MKDISHSIRDVDSLVYKLFLNHTTFSCVFKFDHLAPVEFYNTKRITNNAFVQVIRDLGPLSMLSIVRFLAQYMQKI